MLDHQTTGNLDWNADASVVQAALEALPAVGAGNVVVSRNDDVYTIRFQGTLSNAPIQQLVANAQPSLQKRVEQLGGGVAIVERHGERPHARRHRRHADAGRPDPDPHRRRRPAAPTG